MHSLPSNVLSDLTWSEVAEYLAERRSILVPIGSTEQHGPAGPLGLDTLVALGLSEDAAQQSGALVAPPIWIGDSHHHGAFPGTLWVRAATLIAFVSDVADSLAQSGFTRQIWVNGHKGSNLPALQIALRELYESKWPTAQFAIADPLHLGRDIGERLRREPEHHGGALELSQLMFRYPGKVREALLSSDHADLSAHGGGI